MSIFFGSNTGTCQGLADRLVATALQHGFTCTTQPLNDAVGGLPITHPVVILSSTHYEGLPPGNAAQFVKWIKDQQSDRFREVHYAVFGCGNREWQHTYQATPIFLDSRLKELGAQAVAERGLADAGEGNIFADFDTWQSDHLWPGITLVYGQQAMHDGIFDAPDTKVHQASIQGPSSTRALRWCDVIRSSRNSSRPWYSTPVFAAQNTRFTWRNYG
ncbi:flavoprotein-like protein [Xylariomycetidae sp. FL2044]|nr:flavoprotein-like protein [Xylariomycetidae sp. FL2044]